MNESGKGFSRRAFIKSAGMAAPLIFVPSIGTGSDDLNGKRAGAELAADLVIVGGGLGGCAAALAAARNHLRVIMTEETDWIGGQLTQQAVSLPDENQWIETVGGTRSYLNLRKSARDFYFRNYPLTPKARANPQFNPGNCWVSRVGCEPRVWLSVLYEALMPFLGNGRLQILLRHKLIGAETDGNRVKSVRVLNLDSGNALVLRSAWFADATEMGDLLPATGTEYVVGAESQKESGEPHAKSIAEPNDLQSFTQCFAMDYLPDEDNTIARPADYAFWRGAMTRTFWGSYRLLSFDDPDCAKIGFSPDGRKGFWTYRRIADRNNFLPDFYQSDITIVNWPQNDYSLGPICDVSDETAAMNLARSKQLSLSLLYWLQTEAPRSDGGAGWRGLRLRPDIVGTEGGMAKYPYIREGRRIRAEYTVVEQDVSLNWRIGEMGLKGDQARAKAFADSVGIGSYAMDIHSSTGGEVLRLGKTLPFQIPLGALIPARMENLLPACKNIGVTHLTNGCFRVHPVEWNIGEAAGSLAAFCIARQKQPREVRNQPDLLADFQKLLRDDGVRLEWPNGIHVPIELGRNQEP
ncbi:MAG TPA: FAD-dependent oxidoreductase [Candidatus Sulfotelmatobacter sp.]|nr:FAD-dependent oxidoreductase [Candidatus Sulfotelmatobacter sp.]